MNIPPNIPAVPSGRGQAMSAEQYDRLRDSQDRLRLLRKEHKQRQRTARRETVRRLKRSQANSAGLLTAALAQRAYVPSAPTLRKRTQTRA